MVLGIVETHIRSSDGQLRLIRVVSIVRLVDLADIRRVDVRVLLDVAVPKVGISTFLKQRLVKTLVNQLIDLTLALCQVSVGSFDLLFLLHHSRLDWFVVKHDLVDLSQVYLELLRVLSLRFLLDLRFLLVLTLYFDLVPLPVLFLKSLLIVLFLIEAEEVLDGLAFSHRRG